MVFRTPFTASAAVFVLVVFMACTSAPRQSSVAATPMAVTPTTRQDSATDTLTKEIAERDSVFFDAQFIACDPARVGTLITKDFEFYHDQAGVVATSDSAFVALLRGLCQRQADGTDYRIRRRLVAGTLEVSAMKGYGAVATGTHRFYKRADGKPDELTGIAKFVVLWKREPDGWRMSRVISYEHRPAS